MCLLIREKSLLTIIKFLITSPISHMHHRFYTLYSLIHIVLPDSWPTSLVWQYSDKTDILNSFRFECVNFFIQSKENVMPFSIWCEFPFHERNICTTWKNRIWSQTWISIWPLVYWNCLHQYFLMASFYLKFPL